MQEQSADMFKKIVFENDTFLSEEDFTHINGDLSLMPEISVMQDFLEEEETLDAAVKFNPTSAFIPKSPIGPPETASFPGFLNFGVEIKASETDRKKFLYSAKLNRIYVDMGVEFPVHFTWNTSNQHMPGLDDFYVRATVVFSDDAQKEKRVERCLQHAHEPTAHNPGDEAVVRNVLRSARALGTAGVHYCGAAQLPDSWLSVLVRLPQPAPHAYQFVCKNSCSSGINRRNTAIVFTLENQHGQILGRQSVGARVCACLKRDLRRDEEELGKGKRRLAPAAPAPPATLAASATDACKKIKIEVPDTDDEVITLPKLQIKGAKAVVTGLEVMQRMMEVSGGEAARRNDQRALDQYSACLAGLAHALDNLKKSLPGGQ